MMLRLKIMTLLLPATLLFAHVAEEADKPHDPIERNIVDLEQKITEQKEKITKEQEALRELFAQKAEEGGKALEEALKSEIGQDKVDLPTLMRKFERFMEEREHSGDFSKNYSKEAGEKEFSVVNIEHNPKIARADLAEGFIAKLEAIPMETVVQAFVDAERSLEEEWKKEEVKFMKYLEKFMIKYPDEDPRKKEVDEYIEEHLEEFRKLKIKDLSKGPWLTTSAKGYYDQSKGYKRLLGDQNLVTAYINDILMMTDLNPKFGLRIVELYNKWFKELVKNPNLSHSKLKIWEKYDEGLMNTSTPNSKEIYKREIDSRIKQAIEKSPAFRAKEQQQSIKLKGIIDKVFNSFGYFGDYLSNIFKSIENLFRAVLNLK